MTLEHDPRKNHLLGMLPWDEYQRLAPHLELVELTLAHTLAERGEAFVVRALPIQPVSCRRRN